MLVLPVFIRAIWLLRLPAISLEFIFEKNEVLVAICEKYENCVSYIYGFICYPERIMHKLLVNTCELGPPFRAVLSYFITWCTIGLIVYVAAMMIKKRFFMDKGNV